MRSLLEGTADDLRHDLALAREELVGLRTERERLMSVVANPVSLDSLAAAWEAAEVPTDDNPIREGDLCCVLMSGTWIIGEVGEQWSPDPRSDARILSRAPREPWQDLADVISEYTYQSEPDALAQALYRRGVRVTGGDE